MIITHVQQPNEYFVQPGTRVQRDPTDDSILFFLPDGRILEYTGEDDCLKIVTQH